MARNDSRERGDYRGRASRPGRDENRNYSNNDDFGSRFDDGPGQSYDGRFSREGHEAYGQVEQDRFGNWRGEDRSHEAGVNYGSSTYRSSESRGQALGDYDYDRDYYGGANRMGRRNAEDYGGARYGGERGGRTYGRGDNRGDRFEPTNRFEGRYGDNPAYPYSGEGHGRAYDRTYDRSVGEARGAERDERPGRSRDQGYRSGYDWRDDDRGRSRQARFDDHYMNWREQQIRQMDSDYEAFMREGPDSAQQDFETWRNQRRQSNSGSRNEGETTRTKSRAQSSAKRKTTAKAKSSKSTATSPSKSGGTKKASNPAAKSTRGAGSDATRSNGMGSGLSATDAGQTDTASLRRR